MLKKLISGVCLLGLVCTLMVGCTEDIHKNAEKAQEYDNWNNCSHEQRAQFATTLIGES